MSRISYDEMLELASLGAGVMHSRSIEFAKKYRVPLLVRPAYSQGEGTLIAPPSDAAPAGRPAWPRWPERIARQPVRNSRPARRDEPDLHQMAVRKIPIDMVVQDVGAGGLAEVSFTVPQDDWPRR